MSQNFNPLRRSAYHLMSLASLGQFFIVMAALLVSFVLARGQAGGEVFASADWMRWADEVRPITHGYAFAFILMTWTPVTLGQVWVLLRLRRVASSIYHNDPLSLPVAASFQALAGAVPVYLMLSLFGPSAVSRLLGLAVPPLGLDFGGLYLGVVAFIALRVVAALISQAVEVADENRTFV